MDRKKFGTGGKLAFATIVATGMATAPLALKPAAAQDSNPGYAEERATMKADGNVVGSNESVYEMLGTTRDKAESATGQTSASAQYGPLETYQTEVERGNLDAAAERLAEVSERPITEKLVTDVNTELGIETTLTAKQIADSAARKQNDSDS